MDDNHSTEKQEAAVKNSNPGNLIERARSKKLIKIIVWILSFSGVSIVALLVFVQESCHAARKYRVLVPLYASSQEYLDFMALPDGRYPREKYRRKVSGDTIYAVEAAKKSWFKNKPANTPKHFNEDAVDFFYYPEGYDEASYKAAFDKAMKIAEEEDYEVIAVIGHVTSSVTRACGKLYGPEGKNLPMILPLATASDLTNYLKGTCRVPAVLRLPPSNAKQAELIATFLTNQQAFRVIIAKDLSNPTYSDDLVESFRDSFVRGPFEKEVEKRKPSVPNQFLVSHGRILAVIRGGESGETILDPIIRDLNVDAFIMAGMTEFTLETLAQACASNLHAKYTILTDGAVDEYLLPRINRLISDPHKRDSKGVPVSTSIQALSVPQSGKVYMAFPLEAPISEKLKKVLAESEDERNLEMTHAQYAIDAVQILLATLNEDVVIAGYDWFQKAKDIIAARINKWIDNKQIGGVKLTYDETRIYRVDGTGNSNGIDYHLYYAVLPGLERNAQPPNWEIIKWSHDIGNCPIELAKQPPKK